MSVTQYQIKGGDTLLVIAVEHGTTVDAIMQMNFQISNANEILAGQVISLPNDGGLISQDDFRALQHIDHEIEKMGPGEPHDPVQRCPCVGEVIKLKCFYEEGTPVENIAYTVEQNGTFYKGMLTDGSALITNVEPGDYEVSYQAQSNNEIEALRRELKNLF